MGPVSRAKEGKTRSRRQFSLRRTIANKHSDISVHCFLDSSADGGDSAARSPQIKELCKRVGLQIITSTNGRVTELATRIFHINQLGFNLVEPEETLRHF